MFAGYATNHDLLREYNDRYKQALDNGTLEPWTFPFALLPQIFALLYLLFPPRSTHGRLVAKWSLVVFILWHSLYVAGHQRAQNVAIAFGVGLYAAWNVIWTLAIIVVYDPFVEFKRIIYAPISTPNGMVESNGHTNGHAKSSSSQLDPSNPSNLPRQRNGTISESPESKELETPRSERRYAWQSYPSAISDRLVWVLDLFFNLRGVGWNWHLKALPTPPKRLQEDLDYRTRPSCSAQRLPPASDRLFFLSSLQKFLTVYLILDVLKVLMMKDPYFWSLMPPEYPPAYPSWLPSDAPAQYPTATALFLRAYRLFLTQSGVQAAIKVYFALGNLLFCSLLGPKFLGPHGETWMYLDPWGPYSIVLERGLAGWWGGWWHQLFRFGFDSGAKGVVAVLGAERKSITGRVISLLVPFLLSGVLHAMGSWTAVASPTSPLTGSLLFFAIQPIGIVLELLLTKALKSAVEGNEDKVPSWMPSTLRFIYVHAWMMMVGPLGADEFAREGLWLLEPVPFSPLRALGLGVEGDGWWCWGGRPYANFFEWYDGDKWWKSGWYIITA